MSNMGLFFYLILLSIILCAAFFADKSQPCFYRGGGYNMSLSAIIFNFIGSPGGGDKNLSSRFVIINE